MPNKTSEKVFVMAEVKAKTEFISEVNVPPNPLIDIIGNKKEMRVLALKLATDDCQLFPEKKSHQAAVISHQLSAVTCLFAYFR